MADSIFKLQTGELDEASKKIAEAELRETPEVRSAAIEELRQLLHNAEDLYFRDDDDFLLIFLRPCHFYPESALKMMRNIAKFKKENTAILKNLMPDDEYSSFTDNDIVNVLTNRDQYGRRVLIVNCGELWNPSRVSSDQLFRIFYLVHVAAMVETPTQVRGVVCIMDFNGLGMQQIRGLSPSFSKRLLTFIQEAMPLRMKQVHIINQPFIFNLVWKLFKPFIQAKLNSRMFFHGKDLKSLHKYLDPAHLPTNYGGTLPALNYGGKDWYPCIKDHEDHISKWNSYGYSNAIP